MIHALLQVYFAYGAYCAWHIIFYITSIFYYGAYCAWYIKVYIYCLLINWSYCKLTVCVCALDPQLYICLPPTPSPVPPGSCRLKFYDLHLFLLFLLIIWQQILQNLSF